ncbi:sensor histidine kinase [Cellulomonas sp. NS3]|uniref:sensor histidine kinase n=1 Tax=Cellulomonas sp. NS3 TaxID=2973977 RepID=UPI0021622B56|nr:histidine kinase [Cellulomonas sp. NS3]
MSTPLRATVRAVGGSVVGAVAVPADVAVLVVAVLCGPLSRVSRRAGAARSTLLDRAVALHARRLTRWLGWTPAPASVASRTRYLGAHVLVGLACAGVAGLLVYGVVGTVAVLASWLLGVRLLGSPESAPTTGTEVATLVLPGALLLYLAVAGLVGIPVADRHLADTLLAGRGRRALELRVEELTAARAEIVAAVEAERRRIERDLHDGVQQHAVAVGMLVDRGRRATDPARREELLVAARSAAEQLVAEVRDAAWRVRPAAVDALGLRAALEDLAARAPQPTTLALDLAARSAPAVERCVYYVVAETLTNVGKHAGATSCRVEVRQDGGTVRVRVRDDGVGGARLDAGRGLAGLAARVQAEGGTLGVSSPAGGPTVVEVRIPCGS